MSLDPIREASALYYVLRCEGHSRAAALEVAGMRWKFRAGGAPVTEAVFPYCGGRLLEALTPDEATSKKRRTRERCNATRVES